MINREVKVFNKGKSEDNPLKKPSIALFIGPTGSGKSTYLLNYLEELQKEVDFTKALFVSTNKKDKILEHIGEMEITSDPDVVKNFVDEISQMNKLEAKENPSIIVFDDVQGSKLIDIKNNPWLNSFVLSHRHHNCWVCFTLQSLKNSLSPTLRKNASLIWLFPPRNASEEEAVIGDLPVDKQKMKRIFELARAEEHTPVYINLQKLRPRIYFGFNTEINI